MASYNILDYGAEPSDQLQTERIQAAIDACFLAGGGEVIVPAGIFRTGGLRLRSHVTVRLLAGAVIEGSPDPEDYGAYLNDTLEPLTVTPAEDFRITRSAQWYSRWSNGLFKAVYAEDIAIIGEPGSFIDGRNCYDPQGERDFRGPHPISFWYCRGVRLEGYTIRDSANWAHAIFNSEDVTLRSVTVYGGHDGFNVRTCDRVLVEDCAFYTGDDCIAGFDNYDVTVRRCFFNSPCYPFRFGATKMLVEDCRAKGPGLYGHRYSLDDERKKRSLVTDSSARHTSGWGFVYYCDFRADIRHDPGDITIRRCRFENLLGLFCLPFELENRWCINRSLGSIRFEDCEALGVRRPIFIRGDLYEPITFEMENVRITPAAGCETLPALAAENFARIDLKNVVFDGFTDPKIFTRTPGEVTVEGGTPLPVRHLGTIREFYQMF